MHPFAICFEIDSVHFKKCKKIYFPAPKCSMQDLLVVAFEH